ncbi:MAG: hypothetical protein HY242_09145 [Afipia sp.]|nr:hypothetical protein [Afipia sp.]
MKKVEFKQEIGKRRADAYFHLEDQVCSVGHMATLCADLLMDAGEQHASLPEGWKAVSDDQLEQLQFAANQSEKLALALKAEYYARF